MSSSLIRMNPHVLLSSEYRKAFCLGLPDWCPCDDCSKVESVEEPVKSSTTLKLDDKKPLKLKHNKNRCSNELTKSESLEPCSKEPKVDADQRITNDDLNKLKENNCPANTLKNNMWALKTFKEWWVAGHRRFPGDPCPENILIADNKEILCCWLCKFVSKDCKANGQEYIPRRILAKLQRYILQENRLIK